MMANTQELHNMTVIITPNEYNRLWCGELTLKDFSTGSPNPVRIDKIARGVNKYLDYKKKQLEV